jgi:hypothetical protein
LIDAFASLRHYADHIQPVWSALPREVRGTFWRPGAVPRRRDITNHVLVASFRDAETMGGSRLLYVEHGAGQSYDGDPRGQGNGSYSGGTGLERARLFLCPSERVAARWRERYDVPAVAVGCPRLDALQKPRGETGLAWHKTGEAPLQPAVAVTFHFECGLVPETRSAWRHYDHALPGLVTDPRWRVVGHGHPRLWPSIQRRWHELGVDHYADPDVVLGQADVLVGDTTSLLYEAAALGIPVVCLNAPFYRRDVEHGLRFWSHPPGLQVDHPRELPEAIARALDDGPALRSMRSAAVAAAYGGLVDGHASERAAAAILEVVRA